MSTFKSIALIGAFIAATPAAAADFVSNEPGPYSIPGTGWAGPADPFPITFTVSGVGSITDVNLTLTGLTHNLSANIIVALVSPMDTAVLVMSDVGRLFGSFNNATITFDDEAASALPQYTSSAIPSGSYLPSAYALNPIANFLTDGTTLDLFDGEDANGVWELYIWDDNFLGGTGELASATLSISAVPEPATWALMIGGFALAGMQMRRRKTSVGFA